MSLERNLATIEGSAIRHFGDIRNMSFVSFVGNYVPCNAGEVRENVEVEVRAKTSTDLASFLQNDPQYQIKLAIFYTLQQLRPCLTHRSGCGVYFYIISALALQRQPPPPPPPLIRVMRHLPAECFHFKNRALSLLAHLDNKQTKNG